MAAKSTGLTPFTPETARAAAQRSAEVRRRAGPRVKFELTIEAHQDAELRRRGLKRGELLRRLLAEYLSR